MDESQSKYNINVTRDVFIVGEPAQVALIKKLLKPYYFLNLKDATAATGFRDEHHFLLVAADLADQRQLLNLTTTFNEAESPLAYRIVYVVQPESLTREQLLFLQEIGARFVAMGMQRNDELKERLKRHCLEAHQTGALDAFATDVDRCLRAHDIPALKRIIEKLKELPASGETLRLLAVACMGANDFRRGEVYLKKLLQHDAQNLWAANTLGKLYLRGGRVAEGIEVLQRLSRYHELNSERLLTLGDAYVNAGQAHEAEVAYKKGDQLTAGADPRFKDGLVKVKMQERNFASALTLLGGRGLSENLISFLNMRAIIAIKGGTVDEGIAYYQCAFDGAVDDKLTKAKLKFNMGLAFARSGDLEAAQGCLLESVVLGGHRFDRAKKPLEVVKNAIKGRDKAKKPAKEPLAMLDDSEWETLY